LTPQALPEQHTTGVFVVDDHAVVRRGIRSLCDIVEGLDFIGEAHNGIAALEQLQHLEPLPDVLLLDLQMPDSGGLEVIPRIVERHPRIAIVVLTGFGVAADARAALSSCAQGYLLKDADPEEIVAAIKAAARGEMPLDPSITAALAARPGGRPIATSSITRREREVAALLAEGLTNREIAGRLAISERTARTHVSNLLRKLQLSSRTQAALWATQGRTGSATASGSHR
jgi:DNA-binding NarL/FixJ family response regulator